MKILALLKGDQRDHRIIRTLERLSSATDEVILLNVVHVNGEIPLKMNGEVLDVCTEFDLSGYRKEAEEATAEINKMIPTHDNYDVQAKVGNPLKIVLSSIKEFGAEFVVSGAHVTTHFEDLITDSFAAQLIKNIEVPYLTLNSEGAENNFENITIINQGSLPVDLSIIELFQKRTGAKVHMIHYQEIHEKPMDQAASDQYDDLCDCNNFQCKLKTIENIEKEISELVQNEDVGMLAYSDKHASDFNYSPQKSKGIDLVNHIDFSILIF